MARLTKWDGAEYLDSEEAIAEFLQLAAERGDESHYINCLSNALRARAINQLAKDTGIARENIFKLFAEDATSAKPNQATLAKIAGAIGSPLAQAAGAAMQTPQAVG
jgi:probable addiction module antidote protein